MLSEKKFTEEDSPEGQNSERKQEHGMIESFERQVLQERIEKWSSPVLQKKEQESALERACKMHRSVQLFTRLLSKPIRGECRERWQEEV